MSHVYFFHFDYYCVMSVSILLRSLGCILYELVVGAPPFCTTSLLQLIRKIRYETVPWPKNVSSECLNFIQGLLEKDPRSRSTWPNLAKHPFLRNGVLTPPDKSTCFYNLIEKHSRKVQDDISFQLHLARKV